MPYTAPKGTPVYWGEATKRGLKNPTIINTAISWDGINGDAFLDRYAGGDRSDARKGSYIVSYGIEQKGGESYIEVKQWLWSNGERREPTTQEVVDWSLQRGNAAPVILKHTGGKRDPLPVRDTRYPHGATMQVNGIWYMNDLSKNSEGTGPFPADLSNPTPTDPPPTPPAEPEKPKPEPLPGSADVVSKQKGNSPTVHYFIGPSRATRAEAEADLKLWNDLSKKE